MSLHLRARAALLLSLHVATPCWALSCASTLPAALTASASAAQPGPGLLCQLAGEPAIAIATVLRSTLVRARAHLRVRFIDKAGQGFSTWRSEPVLGQFDGLHLQSTLPVPASAASFVVEVEVPASNRADRIGAIDASVERIERGVLVTAEPAAGLSVLQEPGSGNWTLKMVSPAPDLLATVQLRDIDGEVLSHQPITLSANAASTFASPSLPAGYYEWVIDAAPSGAAPVHLERAFAVVPHPRPDTRLGIDAALSWYGGDAASVARSVEIARLAGVGTIRDRLRWSEVQPRPGGFEWGRYRVNAAVAAKAGLQVVTTFHDSPEWARPGDKQRSPDRAPPTDLEAVRAFGAAFARDMGPTISAVEFWNEQNADFFAGYPFQYAAGLKAFTTGVRSQRPAVRVLAGAAAGQPGPFFEALYGNGLAPYFDVRNQHYYGETDALPSFVKDKVLPIEKAGGVYGKPGWLTEIGVSLRRNANGDFRQAERLQAEYLVRAYAVGLATGYERVFFFFLGELLEDEFHTWGVLHADLSPRPAYAALALLASRLADRKVVGLKRAGASTLVHLQDKAGAISAIAWGTGSAAALAGEFASAMDIWGRALTGDKRKLALSAAPLYLSGVQAKALTPLASPPLTSPAPTGRLAMTAEVEIDGQALPPPAANRVAVNLSDGQIFGVSGLLQSASGSTDERGSRAVRCVGGPGMAVRGSADGLAPTGARTSRFRCAFDVSLATVGRSFIAVEANAIHGTDRVYIPVETAAASVAGSRSRRVAFDAAGACREWVARSSNNMALILTSEPAGSDGCATAIVSEVQRAGETWAFPVTRIAPGQLDGIGIEVAIGSVAGAKPPPVGLSVQFVERSGAVWTVALERSTQTPAVSTYIGLYALAKGAPWSPPKGERLDTALVQEMAIGWGGFGGEAGQRFGYEIRRVNVVSRSP